MRVLWLTKGLGPGGAERLLVSFAELADHDRFEISAAYLLPWKNHLVADLECNGVESTCLEGGRVWDLRWLRRLRQLVRSDQIDIVHVHSPMVAALARVALRSIRKGTRPRCVSTEHNEWSSYHWLTRSLDRSTLRLDDATLAVSDQVRDSMPVDLRAQTEVVIHGVNVDRVMACEADRDAVRAELRFAPDEIVVGTVANLRDSKDYPTLLRAARLAADHRLPLRFVSVGQGPLEGDLRAMASDLGLGDRFTFLGYRSDATRVMASFDIFSLCSLNEGLPIALLEALVLGLPVVVTPVGGTASVVRDGVEGRYVPVGDADAMVDAFTELLDPGVRNARSDAAAQRGREYAIDSAVDRQQSIYAELADALHAESDRTV